jgi:FADH2 O2-dependent halogenase
MKRCDVAIVGAGFGGSILARALHQRGLRVALVERQQHPRFALGESSTPLAALSLERLADAYGLPDLRNLASYGRWQRHLGDLGCGLKRGFTFYDHRHGDPRQRQRASFFVAASPDDAVADSHWLRADVDHHLLRRAQAEGVDVRHPCEVQSLAVGDEAVTLQLAAAGHSDGILECTLLVDATGAGGLVQHHLTVPSGPLARTRSSLLYAHFGDVGEWSGRTASPPYPPQRAAVHHLLAEGWVYELRFDDGRTSAGALLTQPPDEPPAAAWRTLVGRYPALAASFAGARPLMPLAARSPVQHRLSRARGPRWVALPHTFGFIDPLFSTGIAWTLRGVERLAEVLSAGAARRHEEHSLARYESLLERELEQIDALVAGAYAAMPDFELFCAYASTYFAAVSWAEGRQRLLAPTEPMWEGFLGVGDDRLETLFDEARAALPPAPASPAAVAQYRDWIHSRIASRDLAGLDRYGPQLAVPVDLDLLVDRAHLLGLDRATLRSRLPLLRGDSA